MHGLGVADAAGHAPEEGEVGELLQDEDGAAEVEQIDLGRHAVNGIDALAPTPTLTTAGAHSAASS